MQHSLCTCDAALEVYEGMKRLESSLSNEVSRESIIIASLLHDVCKSEFYVRSVKNERRSSAHGRTVRGIRLPTKTFPWGMARSRW